MDKFKQMLSDRADIIGVSSTSALYARIVRAIGLNAVRHRALALILVPLLTAHVENENGCIDITAVIMFSPLGLYLLFGNKNNMEE